MGNSDLLIILRTNDLFDHKIIIKGPNYNNKHDAIKTAMDKIMTKIFDHNHEFYKEKDLPREKKLRTELDTTIKEIIIHELP